MSERTYDEHDVQELVAAAREAAEELYIVMRLGSRRAQPLERYERLMAALRAFGDSGDS